MHSDTLLPDPECLLIFVDDTGHERLAGNHTVYGLGGCAVLAADLDRAINKPWRSVRAGVTGSANASLHASEFSQSHTREQIECVADFFKQPTFMRFAAVASIKTKLPTGIDLIYVVLEILGGCIQQLADRIPLREAAVIFEHSKRAKGLIQKHFTGFTIVKNGCSVPTKLYWMPKSANQPGIEVSDFIMHAVSRQECKAIVGRDEFNIDFEAVFMKVPRRLISFQRIDRVTGDYPNEIVEGHELQ